MFIAKMFIVIEFTYLQKYFVHYRGNFTRKFIVVKRESGDRIIQLTVISVQA